ncbi:hypothetical protein M2336_002155 [Sphingobium sp. B1D7B]|nr:hypothetical protein [Sphingobium sp. B11D3D]MCW2381420.1 hypothetical protein [Sphingobium sp. B2D3B]MCW2388384.1 hypothetical protein [Sphingobium sp. B11D3B]MCW2390385.1 hypothetical protein [Sphingobium sp. B11D3A]MCW2398473.1 hypothetical protein [Sphingobium sp. B2D3C]MCW2405526.1 hypothetical protein [Sphingobium sp. B1D7B]
MMTGRHHSIIPDSRVAATDPGSRNERLNKQPFDKLRANGAGS